MKKVYTLFIICTVFICTLSFCPVSAFQENSFTDSQYEQIGSLGLGHLISDGQIDELDFSNGTGKVGFLVALGKSIVTKDPTYILEYGLNWATAKAEEILQSLENWFSLNFPDLYEFFTGVKTEIKYNPMPLETRRGFTNLLKDRVEESEPVQPDPDVNYAVYLNLLNGTTFFTSGIMADFWFKNYDKNVDTNYGNMDIDGPPSMFSFIRTDWNYFVNEYDDYSKRGGLLSYYDSRAYHPTYQINNCYACEPITLYINSIDNITFTLTCSVCDPKKVFYTKNNLQPYFMGNIQYFADQNAYDIHAGNLVDTYPNIPSFLFTGTLEECFRIACMNFLNVDVYVNGNLWSVGNYDSDDSIIYPIGIPDNFEILSGVPGSYYYPPDSYWDIDGLVQLIKQAITEYGVISINDIAPLIVDINGVLAVRTTNVARNDYDNLISEQYSIYPDDTILQVPSVVLDNGEIISFVATSSGSDLIPDDIMLVLCGAGILLLIGYMINRMLE